MKRLCGCVSMALALSTLLLGSSALAQTHVMTPKSSLPQPAVNGQRIAHLSANPGPGQWSNELRHLRASKRIAALSGLLF